MSEYTWKASGGRRILVSNMTLEHLVNTLNYLERGSRGRRYRYGVSTGSNVDHPGYGFLRQEAIHRGINWRKWSDMPPLHDGELSGRSSHYFDPSGQDSWEHMPPNDVGREEHGLTDIPEPEKKMPLSMLKSGDHFQVRDHSPGTWIPPDITYMVTRLTGSIRDAVCKGGGFVIHDHGFVNSETTRYACVNMETGKMFFMPSWVQVVKVD